MSPPGLVGVGEGEKGRVNKCDLNIKLQLKYAVLIFWCFVHDAYGKQTKL